MLTRLPSVPVQNEIFVCKGGLNTRTPPLMSAPGTVADSLNFMAGINGGYQRIPGYERFDGHPSPTDLSSKVLVMNIENPSHIKIGGEIIGEKSGAIGTLLYQESKLFAVAMRESGYQEGERLFFKKQVVGRFVNYVMQDTRDYCKYRQLGANHWREQIKEVPGSGPVRGVWEYNGDVYALRDAAGIPSCQMYRATNEGWALIDTPPLAPGGRYEFVNANFGGKFCMYAASGTHRAFQFDGTDLVFLSTGMENDRPEHVIAHKNHLFLSFGCSVQHSPIGDPTGEWSVVLGAGEIVMDNPVSGFISMAGNQDVAALLIATRHKTLVLYGNSSNDWTLSTLSHDTGSLPGTLQKVGQIIMLDDRGVSVLSTTASYGNFVGVTLSMNIHEWLSSRRGKVRASCISRDENQYRLFFGRDALYLTGLTSKDAQFMPVRFQDEVCCACSTEMKDGSEAIFVGAENGFVYQLDKGSSFDGVPISYYLVFAFNHSKSPRVNKRYRKLIFELTGHEYGEFYATFRLGYEDRRIAQPGFWPVVNDVKSSTWDSSLWDLFFWDGRDIIPAEMSVTGSGENFSTYIFGRSDEFYPFILNSVIACYTPRRRLR
jgi:hypothetical protein